ncbi:MAG: hypothetical protein M0R17_04870 [Candidatus Omnitrophica bacterium]|jgi:hypothetical protein|nr:hypothetical protein [Candidatus Omnitrophota bacterium]
MFDKKKKMDVLKFGFKRLIKDKDKTLFSFPYLVVGIKPTEPKKTTRFDLINARDLLKFDLRDNRLSWLYDEAGDKTFYLINIYDVDAEPAISVTLDLSFSNKNLYERMVKVMGLDVTKEHYFQLVKVDDIEDLPAVKLVEIPLAEIIMEDHDVASASEVVENIKLETILN